MASWVASPPSKRSLNQRTTTVRTVRAQRARGSSPGPFFCSVPCLPFSFVSAHRYATGRERGDTRINRSSPYFLCQGETRMRQGKARQISPRRVNQTTMAERRGFFAGGIGRRHPNGPPDAPRAEGNIPGLGSDLLRMGCQGLNGLGRPRPSRSCFLAKCSDQPRKCLTPHPRSPRRGQPRGGPRPRS